MKGTSRRQVLHRALAFGGIAGAFGFPGVTAPLWAREAVAIPDGAMLLSRCIRRSLRGGLELCIKRSWEVQFSHQGRGVAVTGRQVSARVDAPESIAAIAKIEQARSTDEMWPILLTDSGRIAGAGQYTRPEDMAAIAREAERMIAAMPATQTVKMRHRAQIAELQRAGARLMEQLPADLFFPAGVPVETVQQMQLPQGATGEFRLRYLATASQDGPWLSKASRNIITRIGEDERLSSEDWELTAI